MKKLVLVFGTFDGLHAGHLFFLKQAKREGDMLFVSVARDEHVWILKQKKPKFNEQKRLQTVRSIPFVEHAQFSDQVLGSYSVFENVNPDVIVFGFDQQQLKASVEKWMNEHRRSIRTKMIGQKENFSN
ncbi:adenylyltransferase/cytidyltransferase family protein [Candidatus Uhrbacteria bacterium]|nr:adenylyltransferase/cytidyltransferase family protein [Candidatus Uhrbacteria bacterium]